MIAAFSLGLRSQLGKIFFLFEEADIGSSLKIMALHFSLEISVAFKYTTKIAVYINCPCYIFNIQLLYYISLKKIPHLTSDWHSRKLNSTRSISGTDQITIGRCRRSCDRRTVFVVK